MRAVPDGVVTVKVAADEDRFVSGRRIDERSPEVRWMWARGVDKDLR